MNLGCGTKTSAHPDVVNLDWTFYLRLRKSWVGRRVVAPVILRGDRIEKMKAIPANVVVHDLRRPLPFPDGSVDAVYHSHVIEHIDRDQVDGFITECHRIIRSGGVLRIAVPDLERLAREYLASVEASADADLAARVAHDDTVSALYEQSVRRDAFGTAGSGGNSVLQFVERVALGDARRRGETHQWMYDRVNLGALLEQNGFIDVSTRSFNDSSLGDAWQDYGLEVDADGGEYKRQSLYIEAIKP
ncbi:MAG: methyltransferase domain-containing protein [Ilumatobacteraceae bacterium]